MHGETVLVIGYSDWSKWRPDQTFASIIAEKNKVIFVERLSDYSELRWHGISGKEVWRRFISGHHRWITDNLVVLQPPPGFPLSISLVSRFIGFEVMRVSLCLSRVIHAMWIRARLRLFGLSPTVLFLSRPIDLPLIGRFGEKVSCWWVYDELALAAGGTNYGRLITEAELKNLHRLDIVFSSSQAQFEKRRRVHPNVAFAPNGVDFDLFYSSLSASFPTPDDLDNIPRPRIGHIGGVDFRVDFDLLRKVADSNANWSLVFIGWVHQTNDEHMATLLKKSNVHFLGHKPHEELPKYLNCLDIGLIPWVVGPVTNTMLPMKLFEYLASGLPVVSTALAEVKHFDKFISIAGDVNEFIAMIHRELRTNTARKVEQRVAIARENSWERIVAEMSMLISTQLSLKREL